MRVVIYSDKGEPAIEHKLQYENTDWKPITYSFFVKRDPETKEIQVADMYFVNSKYRYVKERWYHRLLDKLKLWL